MVNVEGLRVGEEAEVELEPRIQKMIDSGYLRILGHVYVPPPSPVPVPPVAALASPTRVRAPRKEVADGAESPHQA
jgi:hypothetical protein